LLVFGLFCFYSIFSSKYFLIFFIAFLYTFSIASGVRLHFTAVGLISLPDKKELLELIEEIKANPLKSA